MTKTCGQAYVRHDEEGVDTDSACALCACAYLCKKALLECPAASAGLFERLDLADNTLGEEGGQTLAEALSSQPSLTYVNLRDCDLEV